MEVRRRSLNGRPLKRMRHHSPQWRCRYSRLSPPSPASEKSLSAWTARTGETTPVLFAAGQHRCHILCNTVKGLRGRVLTCEKLSVALSAHSPQPDFIPPSSFHEAAPPQTRCSSVQMWPSPAHPDYHRTRHEGAALPTPAAPDGR
ncbi:Uncharacterised protein [Escherichia coli]|nr:Uncharacterised protein [Escherichia coli]